MSEIFAPPVFMWLPDNHILGVRFFRCYTYVLGRAFFCGAKHLTEFKKGNGGCGRRERVLLCFDFPLWHASQNGVMYTNFRLIDSVETA
jgi:hypothetical protein